MTDRGPDELDLLDLLAAANPLPRGAQPSALGAEASAVLAEILASAAPDASDPSDPVDRRTKHLEDPVDPQAPPTIDLDRHREHRHARRRGIAVAVTIAAAVAAVIGLRLPASTPGPIDDALGAARADAAQLRHLADDVRATPDDTEGSPQMDELLSTDPVPTDPTLVVGWLEHTCDAIAAATDGERGDVDCTLYAAITVLSDGDAATRAAVLDGLATTSDLGLPTHDEACSAGWDEVSPRWADEVRRAEADTMTVRHGGWSLTIEVDPGATTAAEAFAASVTPDPEGAPEPWVLCDATTEPGRSAAVEAAMADFAQAHGRDACSLSPFEERGLVALDWNKVCPPSGGPGTGAGGVATGIDDGAGSTTHVPADGD